MSDDIGGNEEWQGPSADKFWLDDVQIHFFSFQQPEQTQIAIWIPDDGTFTMDSAGIWTADMMRGWPVRYG